MMRCFSDSCMSWRFDSFQLPLRHTRARQHLRQPRIGQDVAAGAPAALGVAGEARGADEAGPCLPLTARHVRSSGLLPGGFKPYSWHCHAGSLTVTQSISSSHVSSRISSSCVSVYAMHTQRDSIRG